MHIWCLGFLCCLLCCLRCLCCLRRLLLSLLPLHVALWCCCCLKENVDQGSVEFKWLPKWSEWMRNSSLPLFKKKLPKYVLFVSRSSSSEQTLQIQYQMASLIGWSQHFNLDKWSLFVFVCRFWNTKWYGGCGDE
jgi:hypothetical protein